MVLDAALLNSKTYKVRIKGKVEQSRERSSTPPLHLGVVAIENGAFELPSTKVANFTYLFYLNVNKVYKIKLFYSKIFFQGLMYFFLILQKF